MLNFHASSKTILRAILLPGSLKMHCIFCLARPTHCGGVRDFFFRGRRSTLHVSHCVFFPKASPMLGFSFRFSFAAGERYSIMDGDGKEGKKEGRKGGSKEGRNEGREDGRRKEGRERRKEGRKGGRKEGRKEMGRKERRKEGREEGRKGGRKEERTEGAEGRERRKEGEGGKEGRNEGTKGGRKVPERRA